jgi:hypothetical protein
VDNVATAEVVAAASLSNSAVVATAGSSQMASLFCCEVGIPEV